MKEDGTGNYHIGSVVKALRILDRLAESPASLKVLEQDLSLSTTTTYRIVKTLQSYRLIRQDQSTGLMSLGYKFQEFSNKLDEQLPLLRIGKRYLLELNSQYGGDLISPNLNAQKAVKWTPNYANEFSD